MIAPLALAHPWPRPQPLHSFIAVCGVLAAAGFAVATLMVMHSPDASERRAAAASIGQAVPTSFGTLTVAGVDELPGLTDEELGGGTHAAHAGMNGVVAADQVQLVTQVVLTNRTRRAIDLSTDAFRLITDTSDQPIAPAGGSMAADTLEPGTNMGLMVRFIAPRDNAHLWLEFQDAGHPSPALVALGSTDQAPDQTAGSHHH